ncbi:MAG: nickel-type superoxide dismutase maturation protease [Cyanobacteria bacterium P01_A01_bin.45]
MQKHFLVTNKAVSRVILPIVVKEEVSVAVKLLWVLLKIRRRVRVTGFSMTPALLPGEEVLYNPRAYQQRFPEVGDIVVAIHPDKAKQIIKRVTSVLEDGSCFLMGDNHYASTDSRSFGFIPLTQVLGKVTCKFP